MKPIIQFKHAETEPAQTPAVIPAYGKEASSPVQYAPQASMYTADPYLTALNQIKYMLFVLVVLKVICIIRKEK